MTTISITIKSSTGIVASTTSAFRGFKTGSSGWNVNMGAVIPVSKQGELTLEVADVETGDLLFMGTFAPKKNLTGSYGLYCGGKATIDGVNTQVGVNLTLRNSNPAMADKYNPDNKTNFQVTGNVTVIGSKPQTVEAAEAKIAAQEQRLLEQMAKLDARRAEIAALKATVGQ